MSRHRKSLLLVAQLNKQNIIIHCFSVYTLSNVFFLIVIGFIIISRHSHKTLLT